MGVSKVKSCKACNQPTPDTRQWYCSPQCRVDYRTDKSGDCWEWAGTKIATGYGIIGIRENGKVVMHYAHRIVMGEPDGFVCHDCDNPSCVNPDHLYVGDRASNAKDMVRRQRSCTGAKNGRAKITQQIADEIRSYAAQGVARKDISAFLRISYTTVSQIIRGERWVGATA